MLTSTEKRELQAFVELHDSLWESFCKSSHSPLNQENAFANLPQTPPKRCCSSQPPSLYPSQSSLASMPSSSEYSRDTLGQVANGVYGPRHLVIDTAVDPPRREGKEGTERYVIAPPVVRSAATE